MQFLESVLAVAWGGVAEGCSWQRCYSIENPTEATACYGATIGKLYPDRGPGRSETMLPPEGTRQHFGAY